MIRRRRGTKRERRGAAAVELVVMTPIMLGAAMGALDLGRCLRSAAILTECARNGAAVAMDPAVGPSSLVAAAKAAALSSAGDLPSPPSVTCVASDDGSFVDVTASYEFRGDFGSLLHIPSVPIVRKVRMMRPPVLAPGT